MNITALVENEPASELKSVHGLSLLIQTDNHLILFDLGPGTTLFENCEKRNIDLSAVDTVIISHGHRDHGGALKQFLHINTKAKIYVQRTAFEKHYSKALFLKVTIGLDAELAAHPQVISVDGDFKINNELELFTVPDTGKCRSPANDNLYSLYGRDDFSHEHNLLIHTPGAQPVLIVGCGHTGIVNIMEKAAEYRPRVCIGGYHLHNPVTQKTVPAALLDCIAQELSVYDTQFYTCHCTGKTAYQHLAAKIPNMHYLACGQNITV